MDQLLIPQLLDWLYLQVVPTLLHITPICSNTGKQSMSDACVMQREYEHTVNDQAMVVAIVQVHQR
jgi:hypothetical protein